MFKKILSIIAVGFFCSQLTACGYNAIQTKDENVNEYKAKMLSAYQERADKIPNLVEIVKGAAKNERQTLTEVTAMRSQVGSMKIDEKTTPEQMKQYLEAQQKLSQGLGRLMVISEAYPELKTNQNFINLQQEYSNTEAKATACRNRYIKSISDYNRYIRKFPVNLTAMVFGYEKKDQIEFDEASIKHPQKIQF